MPLLQLPAFASLQAPLTLAAGLTATAVLSTWIFVQELEIKQRDFEQQAVDRISAVQSGMNDAIQALEAVNLALQTFSPVSRIQFRSLTHPLLERYPYIQAFSYHRLLSGAQRPAFEEQMRRNYPDFRVTEEQGGRLVAAGVRDAYRVVDYLEPMAGNEAAFGLDVGSRDYQNDAVRRAASTGLASATGLVRLAQETGSQRGFVVLKPVFREPSASPSTANSLLGIPERCSVPATWWRKRSRLPPCCAPPISTSAYIQAPPRRRANWRSVGEARRRRRGKPPYCLGGSWVSPRRSCPAPSWSPAPLGIW